MYLNLSIYLVREEMFMRGYTLDELIIKFDKKDILSVKATEKVLKQKRKCFVKKFTMDAIKNMNLEEYCLEYVLKPKTASFCYGLEYILENITYLGERAVSKYGVYYDADKKMYIVGKKYQKQSVEDVFNYFKNTILELLHYGKIEDLQEINNNPLPIEVKLKVLEMYFPETNLGFVKKEQIDKLLIFFDIKNTNEPLIYKLDKILKWKTKTIPEWTNYQFKQFCYQYLRVNNKNNQEDETILNVINETMYRREISLTINKLNHSCEFKKPKKYYCHGTYYYMKNPDIGVYALHQANFQCEVNNKHQTFIRKKTKIPFTNALHIIPINQQYKFEHSLDVPENIVSLCCSCYGNIQEGKDAKEILLRLYHARKEGLENKNIKISAKELLEMYGYTDDTRYKSDEERQRILEEDVRDCNYLVTPYDLAFRDAGIPFYPFVGQEYGVSKPKILVVGESHNTTDALKRDIFNDENFSYKNNVTRYAFKHWKYHELFGVSEHQDLQYNKIEEMVGDFNGIAYYNLNTKVTRSGNILKKDVFGMIPYLFKVFEILQPDYVIYFSKNAYYNTPESIPTSKVKMLDKDLDRMLPDVRGSHYLIGDKKVPILAFNHVKNITSEERKKIKEIIKKHTR